MQPNDPNIAYAFYSVTREPTPEEAFNFPHTKGSQIKPDSTITRRPVDLTDIQIFNTLVNSIGAAGVEKTTEDETIYVPFLEDSTRIKANVVVRQMLDRFSNEIKIRG